MGKNTVTAEFVAEDKNLGSKIDQINSKLNQLGSDFQKNTGANILQTVDLIIQRLGQLGEKILEVAERGSSFNLVSEGFDKLTKSVGESGEEILQNLEKTSGGAIAERDLILATNKAILLNVADTSDELANLLSIATARANTLGISATQAFDNIVTGLGRESPLILDNLGIIIKIEAATKKYAESINETADALTASERKQALVNAVIESSKSLLSGTKTAAEEQSESIARLTSNYKNLGDTLSSILAPDIAEAAAQLADLLKFIETFSIDLNRQFSKDFTSGLIDQLKEIDPDKIFTQNKSFTDTLFSSDLENEISAKLKDLGIEAASASRLIELLDKSLKQTDATIVNSSKGFVEYTSVTLDAESAQRMLASAEEETTRQNQLFEEKLASTKSTIYDLAAATNFASSELNSFEAQLLSAQVANSTFESSVAQLSNSIVSNAVKIQKLAGENVAAQLGQEALNKLNIEVAKLKPGLTEGEYSALDLALTFGRIEDDLLSPFDALEEQNKAAQAAMKSTSKSVDDLANKAKQAFDQLSGKVQSVLSSGLSLNVGVNPDDILPRADDINENARRLADVAVKGFDSPWYDYFKKEFPALFQQFFSGATTEDGVKKQAARLIKNFQDGLVPELLDKETAKERVRRALIGEQNIKQLADEIATELSAEFGTSVSNVQAAARSVLTGGDSLSSLSLPSPSFDTSGIADSAQQYQNAFANSFGGFSERFAGIITETLSAKVVLENAANSGKQSGQVWGNGFLETVGDNVPPQVLDILALLVLPKLESSLNRSSSQENAR